MPPQNNKIRVMQITHDLAIGGLQQVVVNICKTINGEKFDVSVLCLRTLGEFASELEEMGINVFQIPQSRKGADYLAFLEIAKLLKQEKIDVVHTHNTQPFTDGTLAALLSGVKTIVHTDHARSFPDKKRYMLAEWVMSNFAFKVVGVSGHTSNNLIKYEHISPRRIVTIPNGIDGAKFNIDIDKKTKRRELQINENGPVIGLGVRLSEQKGIKYLLQAMPEIINSFQDISLVIAGKGELESSLKRQAAALGIEKNVFFIGPRLDMPELLKLFDLYVLPSLWEGLPMVLLEAMAAGCPIVATDVGGNNKAIKNNFNGSLVSAGDPELLATEIVQVLSKNELKQKYILNSFEIFNKNFSAEIMTRKYEKLYLRQ